MSLVASPPPEAIVAQQTLADQLDEEIERAREQVAALSKRNSILASAVISSSNVQSELRRHLESSPDADLAALLDNRQQHGSAGIHRLALGVTSFPFVDPSPDTSNRPLLGIRFDLHKRGGVFETPYYVFCKRADESRRNLTVHKHTLPAFVPLRRYQDKYLPQNDEGYGSNESIQIAQNGPRQDLMAFVSHVRRDLVSWQARRDAVEEVREQLGLSTSVTDSHSDVSGSFGVVLLQPTTAETRYINIIWSNGRSGRVRLGSSLSIDEAVVFYEVQGEGQRCSKYETALLGGNAALSTLPTRLQALHLGHKASKMG